MPIVGLGLHLLIALFFAVHAVRNGQQLFWLFILALPVACVAWTVTHEEVFREPREYCVKRSENARSLAVRKFFYLFTSEYCFSHWVTFFFLFLTRYKLLLDDWRGYILSAFALVAVANLYISSFARLRQEVKSEKLDAKTKEEVLERVQNGEELPPAPTPWRESPRR